VFIVLARKACSLNDQTILAGWLYRAACYAANSALKAEYRRQRREQEACRRGGCLTPLIPAVSIPLHCTTLFPRHHAKFHDLAK